MAIGVVRYYAGWADKITGQTIEVYFFHSWMVLVLIDPRPIPRTLLIPLMNLMAWLDKSFLVSRHSLG